MKPSGSPENRPQANQTLPRNININSKILIAKGEHSPVNQPSTPIPTPTPPPKKTTSQPNREIITHHHSLFQLLLHPHTPKQQHNPTKHTRHLLETPISSNNPIPMRTFAKSDKLLVIAEEGRTYFEVWI